MQERSLIHLGDSVPIWHPHDRRLHRELGTFRLCYRTLVSHVVYHHYSALGMGIGQMI